MDSMNRVNHLSHNNKFREKQPLTCTLPKQLTLPPNMYDATTPLSKTIISKT